MSAEIGAKPRYNRYQDIEIDAITLPHDEIGKFLAALASEEEGWLRRLERRVTEPHVRLHALFWVKIRVQLSHLLSPLLGGNMFMVHHATPEYIMLVKSPGPVVITESIPLYGTHYLRVECVVIDKQPGGNDKTLLINEMMGNTCCGRKLVTGSVELGEYISEAAPREVLEETGVTARFVGILGVANRLCTRFGRDEILVGCLLHADPSDQRPRPSSSEIARAEWVAANEVEWTKVSPMASKWTAAYNILEHNSVELRPQKIPDFRGHGHTMMLYSPSIVTEKK
jgi:ADP-ribose pyrophosphatase YjhB (NUDIX family)